jgi:hypothetical protein
MYCKLTNCCSLSLTCSQPDSEVMKLEVSAADQQRSAELIHHRPGLYRSDVSRRDRCIHRCVDLCVREGNPQTNTQMERYTLGYTLCELQRAFGRIRAHVYKKISV